MWLLVYFQIIDLTGQKLATKIKRLKAKCVDFNTSAQGKLDPLEQEKPEVDCFAFRIKLTCLTEK